MTEFILCTKVMDIWSYLLRWFQNVTGSAFESRCIHSLCSLEIFFTIFLSHLAAKFPISGWMQPSHNSHDRCCDHNSTISALSSEQ